MKNTEFLTIEPFGYINGITVYLYTLSNTNGIRVSITNYGGIITSIYTPDMEGSFEDIVLGFKSVEEYATGHPYFGCITGRYANRIAKGCFTLNGEVYKLVCNDGPNHLHGGVHGFEKKIWRAETIQVPEGVAFQLTYTSIDGEEGYPGNLNISVIYTLTRTNQLRIEYQAKTDRSTVVNLTNHSYFNLEGENSSSSILNHVLQINAKKYTAIDKTCIPTGIESLSGTPLDFRQAKSIGKHINIEHDQMRTGYDHNYVLAFSRRNTPKWAATVVDPVSKRMLKVFTTEPGMQFYSGNFLDDTLTGKGGEKYGHRSGFCLEPQIFPDSPNLHDKIPNYTSAKLDIGETYKQVSVFEFGIAE
jgi:aldose 1-epimerase